jgi:hypothetical protein
VIRYRQSVCVCLLTAACIGGLAGSATADAAQTVWFTQQGCTVWSVPAGVRTVHVRATGQAGVAPKGIFGLGDRVSATINRLAGQSLDVCVAYGGEFTGGGASGVGLGSTFSHPLLVAGGGGGEGSGGFGGSAGFPVATPGTSGGGSAPGLGASVLGAGLGGGGLYPGTTGAKFNADGPGRGGLGGSGVLFTFGGDGGGGYYGGGGGGASGNFGGSGGGGGSDFCHLSVTVIGCLVTPGAGRSDGSPGMGPGESSVMITFSG